MGAIDILHVCSLLNLIEQLRGKALRHFAFFRKQMEHPVAPCLSSDAVMQAVTAAKQQADNLITDIAVITFDSAIDPFYILQPPYIACAIL